MENIISNKPQKNQFVSLENRNKLKLTGIVEVVSAQDNAIIVKSVLGTISVTGNSLRVKNLELESGELEVSGEIGAIKYNGEARKSFFSKIFK